MHQLQPSVVNRVIAAGGDAVALVVSATALDQAWQLDLRARTPDGEAWVGRVVTTPWSALPSRPNDYVWAWARIPGAHEWLAEVRLVAGALESATLGMSTGPSAGPVGFQAHRGVSVLRTGVVGAVPLAPWERIRAAGAMSAAGGTLTIGAESPVVLPAGAAVVLEPVGWSGQSHGAVVAAGTTAYWVEVEI